jgi:3-oxoacyl-[acyl-carrier protein] reductase
MKLKGKNALITGSNSGIGKAIALAFADEGANVGINYLESEEEAADVAGLAKKTGAGAVILQADVSKENEVEMMFSKFISEFNTIDILVNNAGILTISSIINMPVEMWDNMHAVNLRSVFLCTKHALPHMIKQNYGRIINISSQLAQKGCAERSHYVSAKAGIIGFTKSLAREVCQYNITANCIAPGPIETDIINISPKEFIAKKINELPLSRYGNVNEVAPTAVLLAADPDGNIYTGQTLGPNCGDVML